MATPRKATTPTKTPAKAAAKAPVKAPAAAPAPAPAPLNAAEHSQADYAAALATVKARESALKNAAVALETLENRRHEGDESVTSRQVRDAQDEVEHRNVLLNAARTRAQRAEKALVNTSTALADALAPYIGKVLGLTPSTTWEKYDPEKAQPASVPSALLVQTETEKATGDGFLSGSAALYFTRTRLHTLPSASALTESLTALGMDAQVFDGWTTKHDDESTTHSFQVKVAKAAPEVPAIGATAATSETARKRIGYALADAVEGAFRLSASSLPDVRPTLGSNGMFESSLLQIVQVQTGTPSLYSDTTENDTRTVSVLVDAHCRIQHERTRQNTVTRLQQELSGLVEQTVGKMVAGAGRISATQVQTAKIADDLGSISAQVLVSYVSTVPAGQQQAPAVEAPSRKPSPADSDYLEPGDEDLTAYMATLSVRDSDMHGSIPGTHPGVAPR